jgi:hypothetical protein
MAAVLASLLALTAAAATGCGGDDDGGTPEALKGHLPQGKDLGLQTEREFEWTNATDYGVQGPFYSEGTKPSEWIDAIENAGFEAGAGVTLVDEKSGSTLWLGAAEFDSDQGATEARDRLHEEDLKQPCLAACAVTPEEHEVAGIPESVAVHQVPTPGKLPKGLHRFERYLLEFTVGSNLYFVQSDGPPGEMSPQEFEKLANSVYEQASAATE